MSGQKLLVVAGVLAVLVIAAAVAGAAVTSTAPPPPGPGFGAGPVTSGTAVTDGWAHASAGLRPGLVPDSPNPCQAGREDCLDTVVAEMAARLDAAPCAHTAPFAFTYLRTTEQVRDRLGDPGFFGNRQAVAQLDAVFAQLYFDAFDNWRAGRHDQVPGAWQMAFGAADQGSSSAAADILLGMNAHISRDLAFAVARVLDGDPQLGGDRADFERVNRIIAELNGPLLDEAATRFDPGLVELRRQSGDLDPSELIALWRQRALDLGIRLHQAGTDEERRAVAAEIERDAVAAASVVLSADASIDQGLSAEERDAYCGRAR